MALIDDFLGISLAADLTGIVRHQRQRVLKGDSGDLEIVRTDPLTLSLECASDLCAFHRVAVVERQ